MPAVNLKIDDLLLDLINPRTRKVQTQREALQAVIKDQGDRLVALASDIAKNGLNPADRVLVMKQASPKGYVTLEGNRRSEERRGGKEWGSRCRYRGPPYQ